MDGKNVVASALAKISSYDYVKSDVVRLETVALHSWNQVFKN